MQHDPSRPSHEQSLRAEITRLEAVNADLLAACKAVLDRLERFGMDFDSRAALRSAIARAEGDAR